jgi:hypothetical protein
MSDDTLNDVGVLQRREIEARIVAPLLERLAAEYGPGVYDIARDAIVDVARDQGAALAERVGGTSLTDFARGLGAWSAGGVRSRLKRPSASRQTTCASSVVDWVVCASTDPQATSHDPPVIVCVKASRLRSRHAMRLPKRSCSTCLLAPERLLLKRCHAVRSVPC